MGISRLHGRHNALAAQTASFIEGTGYTVTNRPGSMAASLTLTFQSQA